MGIINLLILISSILTIVLGFLVLFKGYKNPSNFWYFLMCFFGGSWGVMKVIQFLVIDVYWHDLLISRFVMFFGALAPLAYFMLAYYFVYKIKLSKFRLYTIFFVAIIVSLLNLAGILKHADVSIINNNLHRDIIFGDFLIFSAYYFIYVVIGFIILLKKYFILDGVSKLQVKFLIIGTISSFFTTGVVSVILLLFNNFSYDWLGAIFLLIHFFIIGYLLFIRQIK